MRRLVYVAFAVVLLVSAYLKGAALINMSLGPTAGGGSTFGGTF